MIRTGRLHPGFARFAAILALAAGTLGLPGGDAHAAAAPQPTFRVLADTIRADANGVWRLSFLIANPTDRGLYLDSLVAEFEDAEAAERHRPLLVRSIQNAVLRSVASMSAGDTVRITYTGAVLGETGRLAFRLTAHGGDGRRHEMTASNPVAGGALSRLAPSTIVRRAGQEVEIVRQRARARAAGAPGVLLVMARGEDARTVLTRLNEYASAGFHVVAVNLPGAGLSSGPGDLAGPRDLAALEIGLDSLIAMTGGPGALLGAAGVGDGASALALLAAHRTELRAVALVGGTYDLWAAYRSDSESRRRHITEFAGRDSMQWRERSAIHSRVRDGIEYLVMHAEADSIAPAASARALTDALRAGGARVDLQVAPGPAGQLETVAPDVVAEFLERVLRR